MYVRPSGTKGEKDIGILCGDGTPGDAYKHYRKKYIEAAKQLGKDVPVELVNDNPIFLPTEPCGAIANMLDSVINGDDRMCLIPDPVKGAPVEPRDLSKWLNFGCCKNGDGEKPETLILNDSIKAQRELGATRTPIPGTSDNRTADSLTGNRSTFTDPQTLIMKEAREAAAEVEQKKREQAIDYERGKQDIKSDLWKRWGWLAFNCNRYALMMSAPTWWWNLQIACDNFFSLFGR